MPSRGDPLGTQPQRLKLPQHPIGRLGDIGPPGRIGADAGDAEQLAKVFFKPGGVLLEIGVEHEEGGRGWGIGVGVSRRVYPGGFGRGRGLGRGIMGAGTTNACASPIPQPPTANP